MHAIYSGLWRTHYPRYSLLDSKNYRSPTDLEHCRLFTPSMAFSRLGASVKPPTAHGDIPLAYALLIAQHHLQEAPRLHREDLQCCNALRRRSALVWHHAGHSRPL